MPICSPRRLSQQSTEPAKSEHAVATFEVERLDADEHRLRRVARSPNEGLVDWLLACPQEGYFVAIDSESTDTP
jgi:hypothetical protein